MSYMLYNYREGPSSQTVKTVSVLNASPQRREVKLNSEEVPHLYLIRVINNVLVIKEGVTSFLPHPGLH